MVCGTIYMKCLLLLARYVNGADSTEYVYGTLHLTWSPILWYNYKDRTDIELQRACPILLTGRALVMDNFNVGNIKI